MLVDTRPYPAVRRSPDAKTDFDGKDLFNVAQAVHSILRLLGILFLSVLLNFWLNGQISSFSNTWHVFSVNAVHLAFGTQATRSVNLTGGYPCVHSWTISYKLYDVTVRVNVDNTAMSLLTNLRVSRKSVLNGLSVSIFLLLLFCDYTMYIYFSVQTSSLVSFNVCFSLGQMSLDFTLLNLSM